MKRTIDQIIRFEKIKFVFLSFLWVYFVRFRNRNDRTKLEAIFLRESFEKLGSVFIKLGQMLALRPDFVPDAYCNEFYKLLDEVPSFPKHQVEEIVRQELKSNPQELFKDFNFIPVASASFAQVHKAVLKTGEVVAIKVQRPNVRQIVDSDLALLKKIAWIVDVLFKPHNKLSKIIEEFESWTKDELNYELEAINIEKFNKIESLIRNGIRGPKVYKKLSTTRVLTMEYIDGHSLKKIVQENWKDSKTLKSLGFNGKEIISHLIRNALEMSHIHGFFHADPHPANIIFTPEQELVFIDFGIVGELNKKERILILRYLRTLLVGNAEESLTSLIKLCGNSPSYNQENLKREYQVIVTRFTSTFDAKTYLEQQKRSGPIMIDALNLLQRNGFVMPVNIIRYFKAFETIEGLIFALYPDLQIKNMVREFRRVSIKNIIDSLPESLEDKGLNNIVIHLINSLEESLLL